MIDNRADADRLQPLLTAMLDGQLTDEQIVELRRLLAANPLARRQYVRQITTHGMLQWAAGGGQGAVARDQRMEEIVDSVGAEVELPPRLDAEISGPEPLVPPIVLDLSSTTHYPLSTTPFVGSWAFSYMVATVIMGVAILGFWAYKITHYQHIAEAPSQSVPSDTRQEMVFVGRITGMVDVKWSDDPRYLPPPGFAHVPLGRKYILDSGLLEITYDSGAKVILEGPCTYEVESTAGGYLAMGKLTAKVVGGQWSVASAKPQAANQKSPSSFILHPSSLFSVRTPTAVVTDLGTEFGVEVCGEGCTTSHVFRGSVRVEVVGDSPPSPSGRGAGGEGSGQVVVLRTNESARVEKGEEAGSARLVLGKEVGAPTKFVRHLSKPTKTLDPSCIIDGSVFHDDFNAAAVDTTKWTANTTGNTPNGTISVADGYATLNTTDTKDIAELKSKSGQLDFSASPDDWWAEVRFQITGILDSTNGIPEWRTWAILSGEVDGYIIAGFDLRGIQNGGLHNKVYDLGWYGNDNSKDPNESPLADGNRTAKRLCAGLEKGRFYTVALHRKSDGKVDIYLDGALIATVPMIGARNPLYLRTGDPMKWNISGTSVVDYVKVGALVRDANAPETASTESEDNRPTTTQSEPSGAPSEHNNWKEGQQPTE